jgi:hypothetical protein
VELQNAKLGLFRSGGGLGGRLGGWLVGCGIGVCLGGFIDGFFRGLDENDRRRAGLGVKLEHGFIKDQDFGLVLSPGL